jgi:hypothetical protein
MNEKEPVWHRETVDAGVEQTLRDLHNVPNVSSSSKKCKRHFHGRSKKPTRSIEPVRERSSSFPSLGIRKS